MTSIGVTDLNAQNPVEVANKLISKTIKENQEKLKLLQSKKPACNFDADKQVLKKVNIPFAEKLYQDLIDLEVKDSDVLKECSTQRLKPVPVKRDPEPNHEDFYQPNFNEEFCYKLPQYTPALKRIREYDGYSISSVTITTLSILGCLLCVIIHMWIQAVLKVNSQHSCFYCKWHQCNKNSVVMEADFFT